MIVKDMKKQFMAERGHMVVRSVSRSSVTRRTWSTMFMCNILILSVSLVNSVTNHSVVNFHLISINSEIHCDKKKFECDKCDSKFTQRNNLLRHRNEKHFAQKVDWRLVQINEDLEFKCDLCAKVFQRKSNLNAHKENIHKVSKDGKVVLQIKCAFCAKEYSKKSNAVRHEKSCKDRSK